PARPRPGAPGRRLGEEAVAVVGLAADGDEELAGPDGPRVGRDAREAQAVAELNQLSAGRCQDLVQAEADLGTEPLRRLAHARCSSARRTSSRSSRWRFSTPMIW